jgi:hypothetical protein
MDTGMWCPMGCDAKLVMLTETGLLECPGKNCPDKYAVSKLLTRESATTKHIVTLHTDHWSAKHPLSERIDNKLLNCQIGLAAGAMRHHKMPEGTYEVWLDTDKEWKWSIKK